MTLINKKSFIFVCVCFEDFSWPITGVITTFINQCLKNLVLIRSNLFKCYPRSIYHILDTVLIKSNKMAALPGAESCGATDGLALHTAQFV